MLFPAHPSHDPPPAGQHMTLMWKKISADKVRMTLVLDGHQGWLGFGVSNDGHMIGSEAPLSSAPEAASRSRGRRLCTAATAWACLPSLSHPSRVLPSNTRADCSPRQRTRLRGNPFRDQATGP